MLCWNIYYLVIIEEIHTDIWVSVLNCRMNVWIKYTVYIFTIQVFICITRKESENERGKILYCDSNNTILCKLLQWAWPLRLLLSNSTAWIILKYNKNCFVFCITLYVNCFGRSRTVLNMCIEYISVNMYHVSVQGVDEGMINVHYY